MKRVVFLAIGMLLFLIQNSEAIESENVLNEYSKTQDSFKSFIFKADIVEESDLSFKGNGPTGNYTKYKEVEYRYDGERFKLINNEWGDVSIRKHIPSKSEASYTSYLWDGEKFVRNSRNSKLGIINKNKREAKNAGDTMATKAFGWINGYIPGNGQRVDAFLEKHTECVTVHKQQQTINGAKCYLVEASTPEGDIKLWLDSQHGYNVAKMEYYLRPEHKSNFPGISKIVLQIKKFVEINGVWIPIDGHLKWSSKQLNGDGGRGSKTIKRRDILLNPDHDALGSFLMDDVENGTQMGVIVGDVGLRYIWQEGELIPKIDKAIINELDKTVEEIMANKGSSDTKSELTALTASDLLAKYQATQDKLQSFIAKSQSTAEKNNRKKETTSEFRFNGNRVNHRSTFWDGLLTTKASPGYKSFLWDGKQFIEYRQAKNTKNSKVFIEDNNFSKKRLIATEYKGAALLGICSGDYDRIDAILAKADKISLRDKTDKVNESDCFVIDAATKRGQYTVWFDHQHGYNIAKIDVQRKQGDIVGNGTQLKADMTFSLSNVRFEKVNDIWCPMEADMQQTENGGGKITKWHHKRTEMILAPDFETLKAFVPDDIPDGTKASFPGVYNKNYKWQNGTAIEEISGNDKL